MVAALLHDVGHLIGMNKGMEQMANCGVKSHEQVGSDFAVGEMGLPARIGRLICAHVNAKRYRCATEPDYMAKLSPASATTLRHQGGPMSLNGSENTPG